MSVRKKELTTVWMNATERFELDRDKIYRISRQYPNGFPGPNRVDGIALEWAHGGGNSIISFGTIRDNFSQPKILIHKQKDLDLFLRVALVPTQDSMLEISTVAPEVIIQVEEVVLRTAKSPLPPAIEDLIAYIKYSGSPSKEYSTNAKDQIIEWAKELGATEDCVVCHDEPIIDTAYFQERIMHYYCVSEVDYLDTIVDALALLPHFGIYTDGAVCGRCDRD